MEKFNGCETVKVRWATPEEIAAAQADGAHIWTACQCGHGSLWQHKGLALNNDGSYNGARNIFYLGWSKEPECACSASHLRMVKLE